MTGFPYFSLVNDIPLYTKSSLSIQSFDRTLGCFQLLTIVEKCCNKKGNAYISWYTIFLLLEVGLLDSMVGLFSTFLRKFYTHFCQQWKRVSFSWYPCQHFFLMTDILMTVALYLMVVFISLPWCLIMVNIFPGTCWSLVCLLWKHLLISSAHFSIGLFIIFLLSCIIKNIF